MGRDLLAGWIAALVAGGAAWLLGLTACSTDPTQILVEITADDDVRVDSEVNALRISVEGKGADAADFDEPVEVPLFPIEDQDWSSFRHVLKPKGGDVDRTYRVTVEAGKGRAESFEGVYVARAASGFVKAQTRVLRVHLFGGEDCKSASCEPDETCVRLRGCVSIDTTEASCLAREDDDSDAAVAGCEQDGGDGGRRDSGLMDAAMDDADVEDAGTDSCVPGEEVCDGVDNDCNGEVDEGVLSTFYRDDDGDGYGDTSRTTEACEAPEGYVAADGDCDDSIPSANPAAEEVCDVEMVDENCNEMSNEDCACNAGDPEQTCGSSTGACETGMRTCVDGMWGACMGNVGPTAEVCNGSDDNCDGETDEGCPCRVGRTRACDMINPTQGICGEGTATCVATNGGDSSRWDGCASPQTEVCDNKDNDCDGQNNENLRMYRKRLPFGQQPWGNYDRCTYDNGIHCAYKYARMCIHSASTTSGHCQSVGGFGFSSINNTQVGLACVTGDGVNGFSRDNVPFSQIAAKHSGCTTGAESQSNPCRAAVDAWCGDKSADNIVGGFGWPQSYKSSFAGSDIWHVMCFTDTIARAFNPSVANFRSADNRCTFGPHPQPTYCPVAAHKWCAARNGFVTGYGPVQYNSENIRVICVRSF